MKIHIGDDITATKGRNGVWSVAHPDRWGKPLEYSTGVRGSEEKIRTHIEEANIPEIVALAKQNVLTQEALSRVLTGEDKLLPIALQEWKSWLSKNKEETTVTQYEKFLHQWFAKCCLYHTYPSEVVEDHIYDFVNAKDDTKLATKKLKLYSIRSLFKFCVAKGYCLSDPSQLVTIHQRKLSHSQKETKEVLAVTTDDVRKIVHNCNVEERQILFTIQNQDYVNSRSRTRQKNLYKRLDQIRFWRFAVLLSHETALRLSDVVAMEWASWGREGLAVWTEKRDKRVYFPYTEALRDIHNNIQIQDLVYCFPDQMEYKSSKLSTYGKRMFERAGVVGKTFHGIRHGTLQRWESEGFSLEQLAEWAGHTSTATTLGYLR